MMTFLKRQDTIRDIHRLGRWYSGFWLLGLEEHLRTAKKETIAEIEKDGRLVELVKSCGNWPKLTQSG
ncbi:MAG: hypothetical protein K9J81_04240 [Desulfohalobiaceae bacterium]|nr:hypothetical protein [Desulfohalobiaceae bacterium]